MCTYACVYVCVSAFVCVCVCVFVCSISTLRVEDQIEGHDLCCCKTDMFRGKRRDGGSRVRVSGLTMSIDRFVNGLFTRQ